MTREQTEVELKKQTTFKLSLGRLLRNRLAIIGGSVFIGLCLIALFADYIAPYDYLAVNTTNKFAAPCLEHIFGTDQYGRDIFSRVVYGTRWSLSLGLLSTIVSTCLGVIVGAIAGFFGGRIDACIMRFIDILQCIPNILLTICICMVLGTGFINTVLAMSFGGIWGCARMLRGQILTVREMKYVEAAKTIGVPVWKIILKYIIPNAIQPIIINACMGIGGAVMGASGLSFLGLGVAPPTPEWGAMLNDGRTYLFYHPNMLIAPCTMIALTILSISLFGDGLRDAMDPRMKD